MKSIFDERWYTNNYEMVAINPTILFDKMFWSSDFIKCLSILLFYPRNLFCALVALCFYITYDVFGAYLEIVECSTDTPRRPEINVVLSASGYADNTQINHDRWTTIGPKTSQHLFYTRD